MRRSTPAKPASTLERGGPDGADLQVDVELPQCQDLAQSAAGVGDREHESLVGGLLHVRGRLDEALAPVDRRVLAAAVIDELARTTRPASTDPKLAQAIVATISRTDADFATKAELATLEGR